MILNKIILNNFRQFRGKQEINFAEPGEKNVTVVHAENGFGKTALLNALHWGFWGKTTSDFSEAGKIITDSLATADGDRDLEAFVEIWYAHQEEEFVIKRSLTLAQQRVDPKTTHIELRRVVHGVAEEKAFLSSEYTIESHLPKAMGDMFFFNGENLDQLSLEKNATQIKDAIYKVLGLELLESAEKIAKESVSALNSELRKHADHDAQALIDNLAQCEKILVEMNTRKSEFSKNIKSLSKDVTHIENQLEANKEAKAEQQRRKGIESNIKNLKKHLEDKEEEISKFISSKAYYLFASDLLSKGQSAVQRMEQAGKIPAKFTSTVLQDVLDSGKCICATDLTQHSECRKAIESLIEAAADSSLDTATQTIKTALSNLSSIEGYEQEFIELKTKHDDLKSEIHQLNDELKEVSRRIKKLDDEDAQDLEGQLEATKDKIKNSEYEVRDIEKNIGDKEKLAISLNAQISAAEQGSEAAKKLQKQREVTERSRQLMAEILEAEKEDLREHLNEEISHEFARIMLHKYDAKLNSDFRLKVEKDMGHGSQSVGLSTGQRQITSLVFIAALVKLARKRKDIPTILAGLWGGDFPMVMDSPFGQLGETYRGKIAEWLPTIAPQVVIFVSDSQWRGPVEEQVDPKIGKEYILEYHANELKSNASEKALIRGVHYEQFVEDEEEFTKINVI